MKLPAFLSRLVERRAGDLGTARYVADLRGAGWTAAGTYVSTGAAEGLATSPVACRQSAAPSRPCPPSSIGGPIGGGSRIWCTPSTG